MKSNWPRSASIVLFTAALASVSHAQTWTSKGPVPRSDHSAVFDPTTSRMVIFGGIPDGYLTQSNLNDVFWLNSASSFGKSLVWQSVKPAGSPPAPRGGHSAAFNPTTGRMIVFGGALGRSAPCVNDTWILINAGGAGGVPAWQQLNPGGALPAPRHRLAAAYDPIGNRLIIFGGNSCGPGDLNDVWVLSNADGTGGAPAWSQLAISGSAPSPQQMSSAVYDPSTNRLIVFGGVITGGVNTNDVWLLNNANGLGGAASWTQLSLAGPPPPRSGHSAVYDQSSNRMTVFGGGNSTGLLNDSWVLAGANGNGASWIQISPSGFEPPAPRSNQTGVYDFTANALVIFGGLIDSEEIPISDVLVLTHANGL